MIVDNLPAVGRALENQGEPAEGVATGIRGTVQCELAGREGDSARERADLDFGERRGRPWPLVSDIRGGSARGLHRRRRGRLRDR